MPRAARLILSAGCLFLGWLILRQPAPGPAPRFGPEPLAAGAPPQAKPFYGEKFLNEGQHLPMVHVASLAQLSDGRMAAVWYGGTAECAPDVEIYYATCAAGGAWTAPRAVMTREQAERDLGVPVKSLGNAVLLPEADGTIRLLFVTVALGRWSGSQLNTACSRDGGATWSRAERLTLSPFFNFSELVRNRPVPLAGGGWCVPVYQEFLGKFPELLWLREENGHLAFRKSRIAGGCSVFQPSLIPLVEREAVVLLRDYTQERRLFVSRTRDGGVSWSPPEATNLPNPDSGVSGIRLTDGRLLAAYNDSACDRHNLALAVSADEGRSWKRIAVLEDQPGSSFSYPYLMRASDGMLRMAYTWKKQAIKVVGFNEAWITAQESQAAPAAKGVRP